MGLLSCIHESYLLHEKPDRIISGVHLQESLLDKNIIMSTNISKAEKLISMINRYISASALMKIFHVFLSDDEDTGMIIYKYLDLGWKVGSRIHISLSDDRVINTDNLCRKVDGERHRMLGLLRFRQLAGDIFYAPVEPVHNILVLLVPHFIERLPCQNWIIHDVRRGMAALYNKKDWIVTEFHMTNSPILHDDELFYQTLWKEYFNDIAIGSRFNPKLQKSNMPMKYWKYLVEMRT